MSPRMVGAAAKPLSPSQAHNALVKQCVEALRAQGVPCRVIRASSSRRRTYRRAGEVERVPDIIGSLPPTGRLLAIEVKTGKGVMSEGQRDFFAQYMAAGALCLEVRDVNEVMRVVSLALENGRRLRDFLAGHLDKTGAPHS